MQLQGVCQAVEKGEVYDVAVTRRTVKFRIQNAHYGMWCMLSCVTDAR